MLKELLASLTALVVILGSSAKGQRESEDTLVEFTQQFVTRHGLSVEDIKALQFYTKETIVLFRLVKSSDERLASGRLVSRSGRTYEIVVIKAATPGIATDLSAANGDHEAPQLTGITISFEDCCAITFHSDPHTTGRFVDSWTGASYGGFPYSKGCNQSFGDQASEVRQLLIEETAGDQRTGKSKTVKSKKTAGAEPLDFAGLPCESTLLVSSSSTPPSGTTRTVPGRRLKK